MGNCTTVDTKTENEKGAKGEARTLVQTWGPNTQEAKREVSCKSHSSQVNNTSKPTRGTEQDTAWSQRGNVQHFVLQT